MKKLLLLFIVSLVSSCASDWRTATRESAKIAPLPSELKESIIQVYVARTFNFRGVVAVHPWISWKHKDDREYTVAQIVGWRVRRGLPALVVQNDLPDRYWFGHEPSVVFEVRGAEAEKAITRVKQLIDSYPHANEYTMWPGPNSNTFVAHVIRNTPELKVELPPHAIGKDWLVDSTVFAASPSGTGFQFSVYGVLGLTLGLGEGIEVNILGLNFGVDFWTPALKLPMIGRIGFPDQSI